MTAGTRYTAVAIALHWLIAAAVIANIGLGIWMHEAIDDPATRAAAINGYQLHKSLGFAVLSLSVLRLVWRAVNPPPPLPTNMSQRDRRLAAVVHGMLYTLMILVPLSGWLLVSTQWRGDAALNIDTVLFDRFTVPHLFSLDQQPADFREQAAGVFLSLHEALAIGMALLVIGHIAAALHHQYRIKDRLLLRMGFRIAPSAGISITHYLAFFCTITVLGLGASYAVQSFSSKAANGLSMETDGILSAPSSWKIQAESSFIEFSGEHAGASFKGRFRHWSIDAKLSKSQPTTSTLTVTIETGSASDGIAMHDRTLREPEWFDVEIHPTARFVMTGIAPTEEDTYALSGTLNIKGHDITVDGLVLRFTEPGATISGQVIIPRAAVDMGMESDPEGEWVSSEISVNIRADLITPTKPAS